MEQMTIFDILQPEKVGLEDISESDMIRVISERTGLALVHVPFYDSVTRGKQPYHYYDAKLKKNGKKATLSVHFSNYVDSVKNGAKFISIGFDTNDYGAGRPADTIDEAVRIIKGLISRFYERGNNESNNRN